MSTIFSKVMKPTLDVDAGRVREDSAQPWVRGRFALMIVYHFSQMQVMDFPPGRPTASAEIRILDIQKISFVEAVNGLQNLASGKKARPEYPPNRSSVIMIPIAH